MQLALESLEKVHRVAAAAAGGVEECHAGRVRTGPGPLIAGQRPQIPRPGIAPARVQHRRPASAAAIETIPAVSIAPSRRTVTPRPSITTEGRSSTSNAANAPRAGDFDGGATSLPWRSRPRQADSQLRGTPCHLATAAIVSPDARLSRAIRSFSSTLQRRRFLRTLPVPARAVGPRRPANGLALRSLYMVPHLNPPPCKKE